MNYSYLNEILLAIILGIVQGVTEFLPISSNAHLILFSSFLTNGRDIGLISGNIIQFGTIFAVLTYFKKDLQNYFLRIKEVILNPLEAKKFWTSFTSWMNGIETAPESNYITEKNSKTKTIDIEISQILLATIPLLILGSLFYNFVSSNRTINAVASFLVAGSLLMAFAEWVYQKALVFPKSKILGSSEALLVGLFQSLAIFPGISRSGATISGMFFLGRSREYSVRFAFLLSVPAILIAGLSDLIKFVLNFFKQSNYSIFPQSYNWSSSNINFSLISLMIAFFVSYLSGLLVLEWLIGFLSKHTFKGFIYYRLILAGFLFYLVFLDRLT